jgi:hypothetical protein
MISSRDLNACSPEIQAGKNRQTMETMAFHSPMQTPAESKRR